MDRPQPTIQPSPIKNSGAKKTEDIFRTKIAVFAALGLVFLFIVFNWAMSSFIHSKKQVLVPDLNGKSIGQCLTLLAPLNLGLKKQGEEYNEMVPQGTVIWQNPQAGMNVKEGKIVKVTISQGGKVILVPNVIGQPVRAAEIAIRSSGLVLGEESTKYSLVSPKGNVISQDPAPEEVAGKDALMNLIISDGVPPDNIRLMPDWSNKDINIAKKWAEDNHLDMTVEEQNVQGIAPGTILKQQPPADTNLVGVDKVSFSVTKLDESQKLLGKVFHYDIPSGGGPRQVRLTLLDARGEREIFSGTKEPGTKLSIPIDSTGRARVRVFMNGILTQEQEIK
jgi:eukaryotic-like serine/threonine-protein kinase